MTRRRATLILLLIATAVVSTAGCSGGAHAGQPELPLSVAPGWARQSYAGAPPPASLPAGAKAGCWKAEYATAAKGSAEVNACGYAVEGSAFDALQRTPSEANIVKFQEGNYLILIRWNGVSRDEITALVRAVQRSIHKA